MENKIIHTVVPQNFIYPDITGQQYKFGSGEVVGVPLREDGDWRNYVPPEEVQNKNGVESSACYIEAQQHTIATIQEEEFGLPDQDYSSRFNALLSNGTTLGGNPIVGADSIRKDGLIPDTLLPFEGIDTWDEFHSFKGGDKDTCIQAGKHWLTSWKVKYDIVFERWESLESKHAKLRSALRYCPVPISVVAWHEQNGIYIKPAGTNDGHLVEAVFIDDEEYVYIWDTYKPFLKKLDKNFNFDFAMRWSVEKLMHPPVSSPKESWFVRLVRAIRRWLNKN